MKHYLITSIEQLLDLDDFFVKELLLSSGTPWLFCGSGWLEQKLRTDPSLDSEGDVKFDSKCEPISIQNDPAYIHDLWTKNGKRKVKNNLVPYWSSDLRRYIFEENYNGEGYCAFTNSIAGTDYRTEPFTLDLCPKAFHQTKQTNDVESLPQPVNNLGDSASSGSNQLEDLLPRSGTLLHESFHLVNSWDSLDATCMYDGAYRLENY